MKVDGIEVLVEGADSQSIVMVHGWPDTHRLWDRQVEALRDRYRCVRFTLPGFEPGHPRRAYSLDEVIETIRRVIEQACAGGPVTLLLHDWGCFFGYQFALRYPRLVRRIVAVDVGDAGSRRHLKESGLKQIVSILAYQFWLAAAWRIGGRIGDRMAQWMASAAGAPGASATISAQMGYPYYVQWARAAGGYAQAKVFRPACPMLYIYGRRKPFTLHSAAWADHVAAQPGSRVLAFDSGHWVMSETPEQFNPALRAWLDAGDSGGQSS